ncbi:MAG: hypothetical protein EXQ97_01120 [Alphaproteobacteria bacterium]|nr:hypothetical protein [Alphaproteobacteria bacterium]
MPRRLSWAPGSWALGSWALGATLAGTLAALPAQAQTVSTTPGVMVDLSVLGAGAGSRFPAGPGWQGTAGHSGDLQPPPDRSPQSRLLVDHGAVAGPQAPRTQATAPRLSPPEQRPAADAPATARIAPPAAPLIPPPASRVTAAPPPATMSPATMPRAAPAAAPPAVANAPRASPAAPAAPVAAPAQTAPAQAAPAPPIRPTPPAPQVAARSGGTAPRPGGELRVTFEAESARLPDTARTRLKTLAEQLVANEAERVQLLAYAEGSADTASQARRLSLSRALAVRAYLIDLGVRSTRIDVRALGPKTDDGPSDRVDVVVIAP